MTSPRWSARVLIAQLAVGGLGHLWVALAMLDRNPYSGPFRLFSGWGMPPVGPVIFADLTVLLGALPWLLWLTLVARTLRRTAGVAEVPATWVIVLTSLVPVVNVGAHAWVLARLWRRAAEASADRDPADAGPIFFVTGTWVVGAVTALFFSYTSPLLCRIPWALTFGYLGVLSGLDSPAGGGGLLALLRMAMALASAGDIAVVLLFQERLGRAAGEGAVAAAARRAAV